MRLNRSARPRILGLLSVACLLACSDSDTIVSVNVCTRPTVDDADVASLQVTISPSGSGTVTKHLQDVRVLPCGSNPRFYERVKLGDGVSEGPATVEVEAMDADGDSLETGSVTVKVRPEEAVVAIVELGGEVDMGGGGAGGEDGQAGAGGSE